MVDVVLPTCNVGTAMEYKDKYLWTEMLHCLHAFVTHTLKMVDVVLPVCNVGTAMEYEDKYLWTEL